MDKRVILTANGVKQIVLCLCFVVFFAFLLVGCDSIDAVLGDEGQSSSGSSQNSQTVATSSGGSAGTSAPSAGTWDNTPEVLTPEMPGTDVLSMEKDGETVDIDISNRSEGYIVAHYAGKYEKVKLILKKTGEAEPREYKYDLTVGGHDVIPLSAGSGEYEVGVHGNVSGTKYATLFVETFNADITDEFRPYLYPNQYVNFNADSQAVKLAEEVTADATDDFNAVEKIFKRVVDGVEYDYDKAEMAKQGQLTGYLPNVDETLATGKGICFDYAAAVTAMLRSQGIPTKLVIGYSGEAYHAWISVHIDGVGWVDAIEFKDEDWVLMDPTYASTGSTFQDLVGDGTNYNPMYYY